MIGFLTLSYNYIHEFPILWYSWGLSWKGLPFRRSLPVSAIIFHIESDQPPPPPNSLPSHDSKWEPFFDLSSYSKAEIDYKIKTRFIIIAAIIKKKNKKKNNDQITHTKKTGINHKYQDSNFSVFRPATFLSMFYSTATRRCKQEEGQL